MQNFLKHLGRAILIGTIIYIVFIGIYYVSGNIDSEFNIDRAWAEYWQNMIFSLVLYFVNAYWVEYHIKAFKNNLFTIKRFLIAILGNVIFSLLGVFVSELIIEVGIYKLSFWNFFGAQRIEEYRMSMLISIVISLVFYAIWYYKNRQENKVKEQKIIAGTASAKFDALKNQLDPHFLFNSLNVLTSLIEEDPYQAQKFTTSLSKVYRYVLEQKNKDLVYVDEELQFAKTYIKLLKMRFEDSIVLDIPDNCTDTEAKIVPLSLQLLLENAVKHNVVTSDRPLNIRVFEEDGDLCVTNNIQEKRVVKKSSGVGLKNIQERYAILTDRNVEISKETMEFTVRLPMLTKKVTTMEVQESYLEDKRYQKAKERVESIKGFYGNLIAYCIVIPMLIVLNYRTTSFPWAIFPTLGWGFGLAVHGMEAFGYNPLWGKSWEERKLKEYMGEEE
ncbi:histidine kinase [Maribacter vaceletii]|uniref:Histidine kinase n=1 Tax=Maribacter vaceletii TaxID=1206816 RepID=A0A495DTZ0_9FLAO|nr:2TM domain-containing protein [Maribacter vaceletii]RKR07898.1 histidine kinase [Maribacter vaceletii]